MQIAQDIATRAHAGQVDKAGRDYITHPARVAAHTHADGGDDDAIAAAWLHDVLEDTPLTAADLHAAGIPAHVVSAVEAVTKRAGEPTEDYFRRVAANRLAVQVKRADLRDNTDPARLARLDPATRVRLEAKYDVARQLLARFAR